MTATHLSSPAEVVTQSVFNLLPTIEADRPIVLSLYLRLEANDRIRNGFRVAVKDAIRQLQASEDYGVRPHDEREALNRDLKRITAHLDVIAGLPHTPGLALFACERLGLFEVIPLPRVFQTRLLCGTRPRLAEALSVLQGFHRILVAAVDRTHTRFFEVTAFGAGEVACLTMPATRGGKFHSDRGDAPGFGEHDFHNRIREERHRRAAAVADQLARLAGEAPCGGVVLAGPLRTTSEMTRFLPRKLATMLLGIVPLNPTAITAAEIREAALTLRAEHLKSEEAKLVGEVKDGMGTGWAVNGLGQTLHALNVGQARTLVIPLGQSVGGYRCSVSGRLAVAPADCAGEGDPVPVPDLISEALEEALAQRVEVAILEDPRLATQIDGMAALLRFR